MTIGVEDIKSKKLTICCVSYASDLIGVERCEIYRMIKSDKLEYKHFIIHPDVKTIPIKKRGNYFKPRF